MSNKQAIYTNEAPAAIGSYSQAIKAGSTVYISGQIPLNPATMSIESDDFKAQITQCFKNLAAVAQAAHGSLADTAKLNIYLTDMEKFAEVNEVMEQFFNKPYPARAAIGVKALPKQAQVEIDAILELK